MVRIKKSKLSWVVFFGLLVWIFAACKIKPQPEPPKLPKPVPIYVQYHTWYKKAQRCPLPAPNPPHFWFQWAWGNFANPCDVVGAPWLRDLASPGYPLIGPYHSLNDGVIRWHIRLAKASGISGFFVSIFYDNPESREAFRRFQRIAFEENFKIGIEGWKPPGGDEQNYEEQVLSQIDEFAFNSPYKDAYLRFNGKPTYWFAYDGWWSFSKFQSFVNSRGVYWLIPGGISDDELRKVNQNNSQSVVNTFYHTRYPTKTGWNVNPSMSGRARFLKKLGLKVFGHTYPGFDERRIAEGDPGRPKRFGSRGNGSVFESSLSETSRYSDAILIESFNDWNEYTGIEPGFDIKSIRDFGQENILKNGDPYTYLKIIASFLKVGFSPPHLDCDIVDPLLIQHGKIRQKPDGSCEPQNREPVSDEAGAVFMN